MTQLLKIIALLLLRATLGGCAGATGQLGITTNKDAYVRDRRGE